MRLAPFGDSFRKTTISFAFGDLIRISIVCLPTRGIIGVRPESSFMFDDVTVATPIWPDPSVIFILRMTSDPSLDDVAGGETAL